MSFTNEHLTRQLDILPIKCLGQQINVIGAGAIGSFVVLALVKMGFENVTVFDFDTIEVENMNCQFYRFKDIGKPKVLALQELVHDFTGVRIEAINKRYEGGTLPGIVITAVDSMKVRKLVWDEHCNVAPATRCIVDPRMSVETALMYVMNPMSETDDDSYRKTLYSDESSVQERCTAKSTMYTVLSISGLVAKAVKDIVTEHPYPRVSMWSIKENQLVCYSKDKL